MAPTFAFPVPRFLQKFAAHLLVGIDATSPLKRAAYRAAMALARPAAEAAGAVAPPRAPRRAALARALVFRWLLEKVGFARAQLVLSSGAPLPPAVAAALAGVGRQRCEAYGQTETGGALVTGQRGPIRGRATWACPRPDGRDRRERRVEVVRGPDLFAGYWRDAEATAALYRDGWLVSGDLASARRRARCRLVDRKKDILITGGRQEREPLAGRDRAAGEPLSERGGGIRRRAQVPGGAARGGLRDGGGVGARARPGAHGYASLAAHPTWSRSSSEVAQANAGLSRVEQVKAFRVLPRELDPEQEGEPVTPTRKVKRRLMAERYGALVESMYGGDEERRIAAEAAALTTED